jgi:DNA modification methylase
MSYQVIQGDCLKVLPELPRFRCIFADPPDNIGLGYGEYKDSMPRAVYLDLMDRWISLFVQRADIVWLSFNAKWTVDVGEIVADIVRSYPHLELTCKPCVQVFTFGQNNPNDLGNNHRPLWRLRRSTTPLYPDAIKVPSWRERNGDKRAKPGGRVPGDVFDMQYEPKPGDVFDFPRVTGNSKQRCDWHPTQLHEELVERCIKFSTLVGEPVGDPFGGTGTTLRVCKRINRPCTVVDVDADYCRRIAEANLVPLTKAA